MNQLRIATVRATGKKYLVLRANYPIIANPCGLCAAIGTNEDTRARRHSPNCTSTVTCFGDVTQVTGLRTRHQGPAKVFPARDVSIETVRKEKDVLRRLLRQYLRELKDKGFDVTIDLKRNGDITYEAFNGTTRLMVS